jgi:iron complex outermembrane receptor protein
LDLNQSIRIQPYFSGSLNRFEFVDFIDNENDYSKNKLPATPETQWNIGFNLESKTGFTFNSSYLNVGQMYLNDANTLSSEAYSLLDVNLKYEMDVLKNFKIILNFGIQNALDEKYAASVLPNAVAFGNAQPRYFYPGNPRNYYGGFQLKYDFN